MAKKMTLKEMEAKLQAQAAEAQAMIEALQKKLADADARILAAKEKEQEMADRLETVLRKDDTDEYDKSIRPIFDFRNYAIPGGNFAVEKVNSRNDNITTSVNIPLDSLFSFKVAQREIDPEEYVRTKPGIYVFSNGETKIRTYYKPATVAKLEYPLTAPVRQFPEAGLKYEDFDVPETEGYLKMRTLTDKETGELVWQLFRAQHYQKPQYAFQCAMPKHDARKLPKVGAPRTKTTGTAGAGAGADRKTTTKASFDPEVILNNLAAAGLAGAYKRRREFKVTFENVSWNITANARGGYTHYVGTRPVQTYATAEDIKWAMVH